MQHTSTIARIFISCPGDVAAEKQIVHEVIDEVNKMKFCRENQIAFQGDDWLNLVGNFDDRMQAQISEQVSGYDIYLGILWMRYGTPTGAINPDTKTEYESGTEEEFLEAERIISENPKTIIRYLFFKTPTKGIRDPKKKKELAKVTAFKEKYKNHFQNSFGDIDTFKKKIYRLLVDTATDIQKQKNIAIKKETLATISDPVSIQKMVAEATGNAPLHYIDRDFVPLSHVSDEISFLLHNKGRTTLTHLLEDKKRITILGAAGAGKSEELKKLARQFEGSEQPFFPIFKKFNTYKGEEIDAFIPIGWKNIEESTLLFIFDGLDEVPQQFFLTVIGKIDAFSRKYPNANFVVSCRSNFYDLPVNGKRGTLENFEVIFLTDLTLQQISKMAEQAFEKKSDDFIQQLREKKLLELITRPFFMQELFRIFRTKGMLYKRAELFQHILDARLTLDTEHFADSRMLADEKSVILNQLEKIAFVMEMMGVNQIKEDDLKKILGPTSNFTLLQFGTAFNKKDGENDVWKFEHNNLQEYLAAKALSCLKYEQVILAVTFNDLSKVKPNWINTLSFFISIVNDYSPYVAWLTENNPDVLVKFEHDKMPSELRTKIFINIFNQYAEKEEHLISKYFNYEELSIFGNTPEVDRFLISVCESKTHPVIVSNALKLLLGRKIPPALQDKLTAALMEILSTFIQTSIICDSITILTPLVLFEPLRVTEVYDLFKSTHSRYIRESLYRLITEADLTDYYIDFFLEGINFKSNSSETTWAFDIPFNLVEGLGKIKYYASAVKIMTFFEDRENDAVDWFYQTQDIMGRIVETMQEELKKGNKEVYNRALHFLWALSNRYEQKYIARFFDKTATIADALTDTILNNEIDTHQKYSVFYHLSDKHGFSSVINRYHTGRISWKMLEDYCKGLPAAYEMEEDTIPDWIKEIPSVIFQETGAMLSFVTYEDREKINVEALQQGFNILFHPEKLKEEVLAVYNESGKDAISMQDIFFFKTPPSKQENYHASTLTFLRRFFQGDNLIKKEMMLSRFDNKDKFSRYQLREIFEHLKKSQAINLDGFQKKWLQDTCCLLLEQTDIKTAINKKENGGFSINNTLTYIWFFYRRGYINLPDEKAIDFTEFIDIVDRSNVTIHEHLLEKVNREALFIRVQNNILNEHPFPQVLFNNIIFSFSQKIERIHSMAFKKLLNGEFPSYDKIKAIKAYYKSTNDDSSLLEIVSDPQHKELRWPLVEMLQKHSDNKYSLVRYLHSILDSDEPDTEKIFASKPLIGLNDEKGMKFALGFLNSPKGDVLTENPYTEILSEFSRIEILDKLLLFFSDIELTKNYISLSSALTQMTIQSAENYGKIVSALQKMKETINFSHLRKIERLQEELQFQYISTFGRVSDVNNAIDLYLAFQNENSHA